MKTKVSRLLAVTLLTPKRIVRSSLPWKDRVRGPSWGVGLGVASPHLRASEAGPPTARDPPVNPAIHHTNAPGTTWPHGWLQLSQELWRPVAKAWGWEKEVAEMGAEVSGRRSGYHLYQSVFLLL